MKEGDTFVNAADISSNAKYFAYSDVDETKIFKIIDPLQDDNGGTQEFSKFNKV